MRKSPMHMVINFEFAAKLPELAPKRLPPLEAGVPPKRPPPLLAAPPPIARTNH